MDWGLFVLALLFVAALQFVVWRRLQSGDIGVTDNAAGREHSPPADLAAQENSDATETDPDVTLCPACGGENEAGYRFCRECVGVLHP